MINFSSLITFHHPIYRGAFYWGTAKLSVSLSSSSYPKLSFSTTINQSLCYGLLGAEKEILVEQETDNKTEHFDRSLLGRTTINRIMKCDRRGGINYKFM